MNSEKATDDKIPKIRNKKRSRSNSHQNETNLDTHYLKQCKVSQ